MPWVFNPFTGKLDQTGSGGGSQADWNATSGPSSILNKPSLATVATSGSFGDLVNKPSTYPPSSHTHAVSEVTGLQTALDSKVADAPSDGIQYARKDGAWEVVSASGTAYDQSLNTTDTPTFSGYKLKQLIPSLTSGLLAYWSLDDDGSGNVSLADATGNGYTLTNNGAVSLGTGKINGDAVFSGTNTLSSSLDLTGLSKISVSAWVKSTYLPNTFLLGNGATVSFAAGGGNCLFLTNGQPALSSSCTIDDGNWHCLVGTYDGAIISFYVDGVLIATASTSGVIGSVSSGFCIGDAFISQNIVGQLDEIGVWGRSLSSGEVAAIYNSGNGLPFSAFSSGSGSSTTDTLIISDRGDGGINVGTGVSFAGPIAAPNIPISYFSGAYADLTGKPTFATVATSGSAADLTGTLADARLSANVPLLTAANTFTAAQTIASGTLTASAPALAITQTWNNSGVNFRALTVNVTDTSSASASYLMDLQVGGSSRFSVSKTGQASFTGDIYAGPAALTSGVQSIATGRIGFSPGDNPATAADAYFSRDAANTLAQRNGTDAQLFRLYNTFTDASNYERGFMRWNSNVLEIGTEAGGTGTARSASLTSASFIEIRAATGQYINVNIGANQIFGFGGSRNYSYRTLNIPTATPASATASGAAGDIAWDANYIYVCTAASTWKRAALATW